MKPQASLPAWMQTSLLVQIVYIHRFLNCLRMKFHLIFLTSIISLFLWVYPSVLKAIPVHKKGSKLNYDPISLLPNIEKVQKLVSIRINKFLNNNLICPLQLPFLINDLNHTIKYCKVHHFANDTNLLHFNSSTKKLYSLVNLDMKHVSVWLNGNKIFLNVQNTELVIFKKNRKMLYHEIKIKLNRKNLYPTPIVKYLWVKSDENLNWHHHKDDQATKLNSANALLFKIRKCVNQKVLRSIYFAIPYTLIHILWFTSQLRQSYMGLNSIQRYSTDYYRSKKATRLISLQSRNSHSSPFFQKNNILKFTEKTMVDNILFISKPLNSMLSPIFKNWFQFCYNIYHYSTTFSIKGHLHKKYFKMNNFVKL